MSDVLQYEIMKMPDRNKKTRVFGLYKIAGETISLNDRITKRAKEIQKYRIKPMDSLYFASAEYRNADILLTMVNEKVLL